jgi:hypothetical protein
MNKTETVWNFRTSKSWEHLRDLQILNKDVLRDLQNIQLAPDQKHPLAAQKGREPRIQTFRRYQGKNSIRQARQPKTPPGHWRNRNMKKLPSGYDIAMIAMERSTIL